MKKSDKENTEEKIFNAAKKVFVRKGSDGARMQEIADEAGINKSLLHYYYRSKDKLFAAVFEFFASKFFPDIFNIFNSDDDIFIKFEKFIHAYIDMLSKNPFIPMFMLNEIKKGNASFAIKVISRAGVNIKAFEQLVEKEIKKGNIKNVNPKNLIINMLGLIIFPFISRPLFEVLIFDNNKNAVDEFLAQRKEEVSTLIINMLKPEKTLN
ncbi:MAG: TetR/AcrR family transcriptional regulator [Bacteroidales bacterium]|nr:TetR/AcrR family transcriptional regulator [Bacteroidales bacterium]